MRAFSLFPGPRVVPAALVAAGLLLLPGCKRKLHDSNLGCVKPDMNQKEVESVLGQPTSMSSAELPLQTAVKTLPTQRYFYQQGGKTVVIYFVDGKLVGQEGSFDK